ncbi:MAG TPA: response regulator [Opitutaceae bacterium]|nr:response regulator [Opitutaceae bacterium]
MLPPPKSVLVVDDQPAVLSIFERILDRAGYAVTCADTGKLALSHMISTHFDVVITDVFMPDMDGTEIIAAVRKHQNSAYVIACSGGGAYMSSPDVLRIARTLGADSSLPKPFTPSQLLNAVAAVERTIVEPQAGSAAA